MEKKSSVFLKLLVDNINGYFVFTWYLNIFAIYTINHQIEKKLDKMIVTKKGYFSRITAVCRSKQYFCSNKKHTEWSLNN